MLKAANGSAKMRRSNDLIEMCKRAVQIARAAQAMNWSTCVRRCIATFAFAFTFVAPVGSFAASSQQSFSSPQAGVTALIKAVKTSDRSALRAIFGPRGTKLLSSGDAVADSHGRAEFSAAYEVAHKIVPEGNTHATLVIGNDGWPMPIPLVKYRDGWRFDTVKGEDEILKRRIGRNEIEAMQVCKAIIDAERDYAAQRLDSDGVPVYASRFTSSPGKHDGLYWSTRANETPSPLGALVAAAADEGYARTGVLRREPYRGYYYRILTSEEQGTSGSRQDYVVKGKMIGGVAVIAYPARYGASGVMSFLINHEGVIYEKDLGSNTRAAAAAITTFNPAAGWEKPVPVN